LVGLVAFAGLTGLVAATRFRGFTGFLDFASVAGFADLAVFLRAEERVVKLALPPDCCARILTHP
jgi:hypothetical protein